MSINKYELTVLYDTEVDLVKELDKIRKIIKENDGKILKEQNEGKKRLAYKIMGKDYAVYYFINIELEDSKATSISSRLNIEESVLRYLLVRTTSNGVYFES